MKKFKHQFTSGEYTVEFAELCGICIFPDRLAPGDEEFWMCINPKLKGVNLLDTLIHESLHAEFPQMAEEDVERAATNIAKLVWKVRKKL